MYVPFYSFRLIVSVRTCFSFLANILSPIPQIQRHRELNTMPHSPLDWLGISAVLMASLSSVPKPGWLHVIFFGTQVLSAAFVPHRQLPVAISTRVSHHHLSSSWRSLLWASPLILFLLGTQDQNPAVCFIPSFLTYNSCSAFRTCIETPYSLFHLSSLFHWHVSSLSLQTSASKHCDSWSPWPDLFSLVLDPRHYHRKTDTRMEHSRQVKKEIFGVFTLLAGEI